MNGAEWEKKLHEAQTATLFRHTEQHAGQIQGRTLGDRLRKPARRCFLESWIEPKDLGSNFSDGTGTEAGKGRRKGYGIGGPNWIEDGETIMDSKGPWS